MKNSVSVTPLKFLVVNKHYFGVRRAQTHVILAVIAYHVLRLNGSHKHIRCTQLTAHPGNYVAWPGGVSAGACNNRDFFHIRSTGEHEIKNNFLHHRYFVSCITTKSGNYYEEHIIISSK